MVREEELVQKAKEVREALIAMAADEIDATHIEVGQIKAKDDTRKLLTIRVGGANRYVPYQGHDTSEFTVGDYWAIVFDDYGTIRLGWWVTNNAGGGTIPSGPHAPTHENGGADEISVAALSGLLADDQHVLDAEVLLVAAALVHKARHVSGGADAFVNTDLLEAIIKRIQVTGPVTLTVGAVADGEFLKRDGATIVGGAGATTIEIQEDDVKIDDASVVNFEGGGGKVVAEGGGKVTVDITPGAGGGAWTLIEDVELAAPAASIDFQNIPGTHKHLAIFFSIRSDRDADIDVLGMRFNNDAGANYDWARHRSGSIHQNDLGFADNEIEPAFITGATSPANAFGSGTLYIYDYTDTAKQKGMKAINGMLRGAAVIYMVDGWGEWHTANAAITRVTLFLTTGPNLVAGSRATLYGIN